MKLIALSENNHSPSQPHEACPLVQVVRGEDFRKPSEMISVHVGPKGETNTLFTLHEHILRHCSMLFSKALDGPYIEGTSRRFELPEVEPTTFGLLVEFLYTGQIRTSDDGIPSMAQYVKLWIFGDYLHYIEVQNYCAWSLVDGYKTGQTIAPEHLAELYDAAPKLESTPMQRFIVDMIVWADIDTALLVDPDPEMLVKVIGKYQARAKGNMESPLLDAKNYYVVEEIASPVEPAMEPVAEPNTDENAPEVE